MKKLSVVLLLSIFTSSVSASLRYCEPGWSGDLGLTSYYYHYQERSYLNDNFLMRDKGPMYGLYYSLGYQPDCTPLHLALDGYFSWSSGINYKSNGTGTSKNNRYSVCELRLLGFYPWVLDNQWTLEGYAGLGGRLLFNANYGSVTSTGHFGYDRKSEYAYVPLGVRFIKPLNCDMYLIGHIEYDWFLAGTQTSYLHGVLKNDQHSGYGARAGIDLYIPSQFVSFDYLVGAFIRHWNIKDSTINTSSLGTFTGLEPRNKTYEVGIRFGLVF